MSVAQPRPLAIIAGGGELPAEIAGVARHAGRDVFVVALTGAAEGEWLSDYACERLGIGQLGLLLKLLRARGIEEIVFIGSLTRPDLASLRPDFGLLRHLPELVSLLRGGDDHLLSGVVRFFERQGFRVVGPGDIAPALKSQEGPLGRRAPDETMLANIALGREIIRALSPFDVGQAVVVANGHVLAIEAAEGTDGMIARVRDLRAAGRVRTSAGEGVLVKAPKIGQDRRVDLPTIGLGTVEGAVLAGIGGIAVAAGEVLIAERERTIASADAAGLFLYAFGPA